MKTDLDPMMILDMNEVPMENGRKCTVNAPWNLQLKYEATCYADACS
jgi:hypothetical protein